MKITIDATPSDGLQITWKDGPDDPCEQIDSVIHALALALDSLSAHRDNEPVADRILLLRSWPAGNERFIACVPVAEPSGLETHDVQSLLEGALFAIRSIEPEAPPEIEGPGDAEGE